jgi:hypothetical protein
MKFFIVSFVIISLFTAEYKNKLQRGKYKDKVLNDTCCYRVYKIDSINNYYLIYSKKNDRIYKIVSQKEKKLKSGIIKLKGCYKFVLRSMIYDNADKNSILKLSQVTCFDISETTSICLEGDSIRDLYLAENIRGLNFIRNKK